MILRFDEFFVNRSFIWLCTRVISAIWPILRLLSSLSSEISHFLNFCYCFFFSLNLLDQESRQFGVFQKLLGVFESQSANFAKTITNSSWDLQQTTYLCLETGNLKLKYPIYFGLLGSLREFGLNLTKMSTSVIVMALLKTRWHYSKNGISLLRRFYIDPSKEGIFAIRTAVVTNYRYLAS